jgi:phosphoribosylformylglycinamidine synthase I
VSERSEGAVPHVSERSEGAVPHVSERSEGTIRQGRITVGVVLFPGSNCEQDAMEAVRALGGDAELLWHGDATVGAADAVIVPGGFAHGDYLRPGALARFSPVMGAVEAFAADGGPVIGICNGFQVLTEAGLLPGALQKNAGLKFVCTTVSLRVETTESPLTAAAAKGDVLRIPINHFEGNYTCSPEVLAELRAEDRVVLRYVENPNGSVDDIAGVCSAGRNVVGLMPHPERAYDALLGSDDGIPLLRSILASAAAVSR